jgi:2-methylcitrate dehydratase PrpD
MDMVAHVAPGAAKRQLPPAQYLARTLAGFAENLRYDDLPAAVQQCAILHVVDVVGCALAATHFDFAHRALTGIGVPGESGKATVLGMNARLPLKDAVLVNGILAHGLDYDDTHTAGPVHPGASAFPCALGLGELYDRSGKELLTAFLLGVEVATRVGIASNGAMHASGFHTTGVAGHMGCAMVAGRLLELNAAQLAWAQGLAGSTASALGEFRADGAWSKRMHAGWAAVGGITAAMLARSGFTGPATVYEGVDGLFRSHTGTYFSAVNAGAMTDQLGTRWHAEEVAVKPFPICHILHACVDAALALKREHALEPDDILEACALLHPDTFQRVCDRPELRRRPATEYIAKFSVYYTVAAALVRGACGFAELEPDALGDPAILALAERVIYAADEQSAFPEYFSGGVTLRLKDGRTLTHHVRVHRGAGNRPLSADEIAVKFLQNAGLAMSAGRARRLLDFLLHLEDHSTRELALALGGRP